MSSWPSAPSYLIRCSPRSSAVSIPPRKSSWDGSFRRWAWIWNSCGGVRGDSSPRNLLRWVAHGGRRVRPTIDYLLENADSVSPIAVSDRLRQELALTPAPLVSRRERGGAAAPR